MAEVPDAWALSGEEGRREKKRYSLGFLQKSCRSNERQCFYPLHDSPNASQDSDASAATTAKVGDEILRPVSSRSPCQRPAVVPASHHKGKARIQLQRVSLLLAGLA